MNTLIAKSTPTPADLHVNQPLTNFSLNYAQDASMFAAGQVFPTIPSDKQSNIFYKFPLGSYLRPQMRTRPRATESVGGSYEMAQVAYLCKKVALHKDIADDDRASQDLPAINVDRDAVNFLTYQALLRKELDFQAAAMKTGVWSVDFDVSANSGIQWGNSGAIPIKTMRNLIFGQMKATGQKFNTLVLGMDTWRVLLDSADFLARQQFGTQAAPSVVNEQFLAGLLGLEKVVISNAIQNTADLGQPDTFDTVVASKSALLCYVNQAPTLNSVTAGVCFAWTGLYGANALGGRIKTIRMETLEADRIELSMAYSMQVVCPDLGVYLYNCVA